MSDYSKFRVFTDGSVNTILDRIYYEIETGLPDFNVNDHMCLTGRAAAILQGAASQECNNVIFLVNDAGLYDFIQSSLPKKLPNKGVLKFRERTIFYLEGMIMEIWFEPGTAIGKVMASGVYVQSTNQINPILL